MVVSEKASNRRPAERSPADLSKRAGRNKIEGRKQVERDKGFARRLDTACENNPHVPSMNFGRLTWIKKHLGEKFGTDVSVETVRKWVAGEARPRPDKMKQLAALLEVDEAWLSLGIQPELQPRERKIRNAAADGAVNLLAGIIQMNGGVPAFPEDGDKRAAKAHIDLYAIIKGAQYAFHVILAQQAGKKWKFVVPANYQEAFQMGVIQEGATQFRFLELNESMIEGGTKRGGFIEVEVSDAEATKRQITNFRERL